jgi:hypothetical protein
LEVEEVLFTGCACRDWIAEKLFPVDCSVNSIVFSSFLAVFSGVNFTAFWADSENVNATERIISRDFFMVVCFVDNKI